MKTLRFYFSILFAFVFSCSLSGCFMSFFKTEPVTQPSQFPAALTKAREENRFFILHSGRQAYAVTTISVDQAKEELQLQLGMIDYPHNIYLNRNPNKRSYKPKKGEAAIITEIHLYTKDTTAYPLNQPLTVAFGNLKRIEVLEKDKAATNTNHVLSIIGVTVGVMTIIGAIVLATKSSCPFVSAYDGNEFKLQGEIYAGSIYPSLQRNDYLPLQLKPLDGKLQVKISNELQERQYTDLAELWSIEHDPSVSIAPDEEGNLYSVTDGISPVAAAANDADVLRQVSAKDDSYFAFDKEADNGISRLELTFSKAPSASEGKLLLHLKNSYWLDYIYGDLIKHMGSYFNKWSKLQQNKSAIQLTKWKNEQAIPLTIEMKTTEGWKPIKSLTTVGPVAYREMVIPLDISSVEGDQVKLRLSSGFMFWELDQAAMDYTPAKAYAVRALHPAAAVDELGKNVKNELTLSDQQFLDQPVPGNVATISYDALPAKPGVAVTYILHTSGYYEHVRSFKGLPDVKFLNAFKQPQALSKYSAQQYHQINSSIAKAN